MPEPEVRTIRVLLVEDNEADVRLTKEALREAKMHTSLHVVRDGVQAMAFLRQEGDHNGAPRPDLILLDLNLPRKDGRQVLSEIKGDDSLKRIPVIVLTTSQAEADIVQAYDLHANGYVTKPVDFDAFTKVVRAIDEFWFAIVKLPR